MSHVSVPVSTDRFLALSDFLREHGSSRDPVSAVEIAIDYWLDNASWKMEDLLPETRPGTKTQHGYMWKDVFLPDQTEVRMRYQGKYWYARIVGDDFVYDGKEISPSQFANRVTQSSRNAWRDLEIKRPLDKAWRLADDLRRKHP